MFNTIKHKIFQHKRIVLVAIVAVVGVVYFGYQKYHGTDTAPRLVLGQVERGSISVSVSGSGQVYSSNQMDLKAKVSGDVTVVAVKSGQEVQVGALLAQLDSRDALKAVRDARTSLESAQLTLAKLKKPADELAFLQAQHAASQAQESKQKLETDLQKAYDDGFNTVANAFLDLPAIMAGLDDLLYDETLERSQQNLVWYANQTSRDAQVSPRAIRYRDETDTAYREARRQYSADFDLYKATSRNDAPATLETVIAQTYNTAKTVAEAIKIANNYIDFVQDFLEQRKINIPALVATHQSTLDLYTGKTNTHLLNLLASKRTIEDSKSAAVNANRTIAEKTEALAKLKAGTEPLDIQAQELTVKQRQNALQDAQEKLSDYTLRAPFTGRVAAMDLKRGDPVSAGAVLAVMMVNQQMAEMALNEVDAAKVKSGQKATLTFDALPELSLTGEVVEIDELGIVSQGVVTYKVKIRFDTQDERVKPGMSVSAEIALATKENVLIVPNSALRAQGDHQYVEIGSGERGGETRVLRRQTVETGLANETVTEIISGLNEGERIVVRTINPASTNAAPRAPSLFGAPGGRGQGGNLRIPR